MAETTTDRQARIAELRQFAHEKREEVERALMQARALEIEMANDLPEFAKDFIVEVRDAGRSCGLDDMSKARILDRLAEKAERLLPREPQF